MGHLGRYHCPNGDARRPPPDVYASDASSTARARRASRCTSAASGAGRPSAPRPLQRLQRARRRGAGARARRAVRRGRRRPERRRPRSAVPRPSVGGRDLRSCSSRTRPGPTRCCARWRSRPASTMSSRSSTTASPTAATSRGSGTPTSSCSPPRVRRVTCSGTRAAELALRLKYAGVAAERLHVVPDLERGARRRAGRRRRAGCSRCRRTRRCSALRELLVARGAAQGCSVAAPSTSSGTTSSAARYAADLRALARARGGRGRAAPRRRRGDRPRRPRSRAPRLRVVALDLDPDLLAALAARAKAEGCAVETSSPTRATSPATQRFAIVIAPMQTVQLLGPEGRARSWRRSRARRAGRDPRHRARRHARGVRRRHVLLPLPDMLVVDGTLYASQPVALRDRGEPSRSSASARSSRRRPPARAPTSCSRPRGARRSRPRAAPPGLACCPAADRCDR